MALEVALAHRDRPLPPLPPTVAAGVCALVMRLAAKDPARRLDDAAEVAVWALLRDGVGVADLQMWPDQPGQSHAAGLFQRRTILAYACVAVTAVIIIVLASVIGFASTPGPVTAAPAAPPSSHATTRRSPPRPPAAPPRAPASSLRLVPWPSRNRQRCPGRRHGGQPGHGNGRGEGNGRGQGNEQARERSGQGKGNGNGQGD